MNWPEVAAYTPLVIVGVGLGMLLIADGLLNRLTIKWHQELRKWANRTKTNSHS